MAAVVVALLRVCDGEKKKEPTASRTADSQIMCNRNSIPIKRASIRFRQVCVFCFFVLRELALVKLLADLCFMSDMVERYRDLPPKLPDANFKRQLSSCVPPEAVCESNMWGSRGTGSTLVPSPPKLKRK